MIQFDEHIFQMGWNHQPVLVLLTYNPTIILELQLYNELAWLDWSIGGINLINLINHHGYREDEGSLGSFFCLKDDVAWDLFSWYTPGSTNMAIAGKWTRIGSRYFLLNMLIFQPATSMLV